MARHHSQIDDAIESWTSTGPVGDPKMLLGKVHPDSPIGCNKFWFAGNHRIWGSTLRNEVLVLSDTSLQCDQRMRKKIPNGLQIDDLVQLYQRPDGTHHE